MKTRILFIFAVLTLFSKSGFSQWYEKKFVIGGFSDPRVSRDNNAAKDSISFAKAKLVGLNLLSGPQFYNGGPGFNLMDRTLDLASKYGMHVMVIDSKLLVNKDDFSNQDAQRILSHFKSLDPKRREAVGGYGLGGEYPMARAPQIRKWAAVFNSGDTDRPAYTYIQPLYGYNSKGAYEKYVDSYFSNNTVGDEIKIVAYDYYPFLSPKILSTYFYNVGLIKRKAGNRPVWYFIQATTLKTQKDVSDYQLRFSAFCPLAYGSKGAIYFTYESVPGKFGELNYNGLLNPFGNVTRKYYTAKFINDYISYLAGPIIMGNSCVGTYHVSTSPTDEDIPSSEMLGRGNTYVSNVSNQNVLIGVFKNEQSSTYYLLLINKSENDISGVKISVPGKKSIIGYPGSSKYHGDRTKTNLPTSPGGNQTNFTIDKIPGGEMTIVQVN